MRVFHPKTPGQVVARDALLQEALRPQPAAFSIAREYPIVLASANAPLSFCVGEEDAVYAHANLFARRLTGTSKDVRVGLVGNVASLPEHRGRGLVRLVVTEIVKRAGELRLDALLLWSDLEEFYQKLGFRSFGKELRLTFDQRKLAATSRRTPHLACARAQSEDVSERTLAECLALRTAAPVTLERSVAEFRTLITIPCTDLFVATAERRIVAYVLVGKGYDMQGVAHEWGAADAAALTCLLAHAARALELPEVLLLAPFETPAMLLGDLQSEARSVEEHPMAWMLPLASGHSEVDQALERLFVWGLDSI